jgi:hypothetical protein
MVLFTSPSPPVRNLDRRNTRRLRKRENLLRREGGDGGRSQIIRRRESLVLAILLLGLQVFTCKHIFAAKFGLKCDMLYTGYAIFTNDIFTRL